MKCSNKIIDCKYVPVKISSIEYLSGIKDELQINFTITTKPYLFKDFNDVISIKEGGKGYDKYKLLRKCINFPIDKRIETSLNLKKLLTGRYLLVDLFPINKIDNFGKAMKCQGIRYLECSHIYNQTIFKYIEYDPFSV